MTKELAFAALILAAACIVEEGSDAYPGLWIVTGEDGGYWMLSPDSGVYVGTDGQRQFHSWRALDDGSLLFQLESGENVVAEVVVQSSDRLTLVVEADTIRLVREDVTESSPGSYAIDGRIGPKRLLELTDSLAVAETGEDTVRMFNIFLGDSTS